MKEYIISFLEEETDDLDNGASIKCNVLDQSKKNIGIVIADGVEITFFKDIDYITETT